VTISTAQVYSAIEAGEVIANIGQISGADKRRLDKLAEDGQISKWRGKWFPVAGASYGIGPDKTCYGTHAVKALVCP